MRMIWRIQQLLHLILWTAFLYRGLSLQIPEAWRAALFFTLIQGVQYFLFARKTGDKRDYSRGQTLVMTLLLGYSWWYPLRKRRSQLHSGDPA